MQKINDYKECNGTGMQWGTKVRTKKNKTTKEKKLKGELRGIPSLDFFRSQEGLT